MREISCPPENQLASQERLCFMGGERERARGESVFLLFFASSVVSLYALNLTL